MSTISESRVAVPAATDGFYSPLPGQRDIRLLKILPGEDSDIIVTSLFTVSLDSNPTYAALSYAWGDATQRSVIECNERSISITTSLAEALTAFRRFSAGPDAELNEFQSTIWADQICINQHDVLERNHQVSMMGSVYSSSACAFIWLGPEDESSDRALSLIDSLEDILVQTFNPDDHSRIFRELMDGTFSLPDDQPWAELMALFSRPWFHRIWTLQEPIRAPERLIACGSRIQTWNTFLHAVLICIHVNDPEGIRYSVGSFYDLQSAIIRRPENLELSTLIYETRFRGSSDPRDKVFALYGLVQDNQKVPLEISYAMSVGDVYRAAVRFCIENEGKLVILTQVAELESQPDLPSWVPDWRSRSQPGHLAMSWQRCSASFKASLGSRPLLVPSSSNDKLILKGFTLAIVERTIKIAALGTNSVDSSPDSRRTNAAAAGVPAHFLQGKSFETIFDITVMTESTPFHYTETGASGWPNWPRWPNSNKWIAAGHPDPLPQTVLTEYKNNFDSQTRNRCLFLTENFLGLAPAPTQAGDKVCILLGGDVPFILRPRQKPGGTTPSKEAESEYPDMPSTTPQDIPTPGNNGSLESPQAAKESLEATEWTLMGDCYLYGYMRGEAMETVTEDDYVNFTLV